MPAKVGAAALVGKLAGASSFRFGCVPDTPNQYHLALIDNAEVEPDTFKRDQPNSSYGYTWVNSRLCSNVRKPFSGRII